MIHTRYLDVILNRETFRLAVDKAAERLHGVAFDSFAVRGSSGMVFGGALAWTMDKGLFIVRKPNEDSHSSYQVEGDDNNIAYIFLDDIIYEGNTYRSVVKAMEMRMPRSKLVGYYTYEFRNSNAGEYGYTEGPYTG